MGLCAIGWYFRRGSEVSLTGPVLFCPAHRPDPTPCHQLYNRDNEGKSCSTCTGEEEAHRLQALILDALGMEPGPLPLLTGYRDAQGGAADSDVGART